MSFRIVLRILAALAAGCVLALAAVAFIGVSLDAERWREPAAAALSRALGREVHLDGPARLTLSLRPELVVRDLRVANPPGFDSPDFARIAELRVGLALLPLLRDEILLGEVRGRDVVVRLARTADGRGNWVFEPTARDGPAPARSARLAGIDRLVLENVAIEYARPGAPLRLELAEITAEAPPGGPLRLAARGRADAVSVRAAGAPLAALGTPEPWPFDLQLFSRALVLNVSGAMSGPLDRPVVRAAFGAGSPDLAEVARLLNVAWPPGAGAAAGMLEASPGRVALTSLNAVIGSTPVAGELALETGGPRPRLAGRLAVPALDLRPFLAGGSAAAPGTVETLAAAFARLERAELDLARLAVADADLRLSVGHWAGLPGDVRDLDAHVRVEAGNLAAPVAATVGGARFTGELAADATAATPRLRARLAASEAPLGGLAELFFDVPHVAGQVRRFEAAFDASGSRAGALARDLAARIRIEGAAFTYGNYPGGRPVAMRLDAAEVAQPRGGTIAGKVRGSLRGKPFDGAFRAGTVERLLRERRTPFTFTGASGGVRARLSGSLAEPSDAAGPELAVELTAPRARELAPWLGFSSASDARVAAKGTVRVRSQVTSLTGASLVVGRTSVAGDLTWRSVAGKPHVTADLAAEVLAPAELRGLAPAATAERATVLDLPILPESLDFADSDLAIRVKRLDGLALAIADVAFTGRMRGGELGLSPFSLRVEGNALAGALTLDARGAAPAARLWLAGHDVDVGPLLARLRIARDVASRLGGVRLYADLRERRLGDLLEHSSFVAELESGTLDFRDANTRAALRIAVDRGAVRADAGAPVTAALTGTANAVPVAIRAETRSLRELFEPAARLPFSLTAELPGARLAIDGTAVPQRSPDVALAVALDGERLDRLDDLFGASLPPWGPYALTGRLRFSKRGYEVEAMRLALGRASALTGRGALDTSRTPPRFDVALAAERIRLDDVPLDDWSPFEARNGGGERTAVEAARRAVRDSARRVHAVFSRELLGMAEGDFDLAVKSVVAPAGELGRGRIRARLEQGRATIGPVEVEGRGGGRASGTLRYEPRERDVVLGAQVNVDRFDYGLLVGTLRPRSDLDGAISLDLRLDATAPRLSAAFATGSGRFDFTVWPKALTGGAFDLWSVNLLFRLLPIIDVGASPMNCIAGEFDLEQGTLRSRRLVIDTVSTRTEGSGTADFATSAVDLRFVPRAKVPQFFSLATPVEVAGTFDDFRFGVRRADAFGTALRWVASPVVVPIQRLMGERIPPDGRDVCVNPGR